MLMDQEDYQCENGQPTNSNLQIQCILNQNTHGILHKNWKTLKLKWNKKQTWRSKQKE